jgi:hypothetical protein
MDDQDSSPNLLKNLRQMTTGLWKEYGSLSFLTNFCGPNFYVMQTKEA